MPLAWASFGLAKDTFLPPKWMSPPSGASAPDRIFSSVDLPAPFSPMKPWISDSPTSKSTESRARTPGKALAIPVMRSSIAGAAVWLMARLWPPEKPGGLKATAACLLHFAEALRELQVVLGDGHRCQQKNLLGRLLAGLDEGRQRLDADGALLAGKLLDGRREAAVAHLRQRLGQRIESDDHDAGKPTRLHRLHGA